MMNWKEQIAQLEQQGNFDIAIFLLEKVIAENPHTIDGYIFLLYRLMDTLVEGGCYWANSKDPLRNIKREYYDSKDGDYIVLAKKYFAESYNKFSDNPEYLYYVGRGMGPAHYFFGVDDEMPTRMIRKAQSLGYNRPLRKPSLDLKIVNAGN